MKVIDKISLDNENNIKLVEDAVEWICKVCDEDREHNEWLIVSDHYPFNVDEPFTLLVTRDKVLKFADDWEVWDVWDDEKERPGFEKNRITACFLTDNICVAEGIKRGYCSGISDEAAIRLTHQYFRSERGVKEFTKKSDKTFKQFIYYVLANMCELAYDEVIEYDDCAFASEHKCFECDVEPNCENCEYRKEINLMLLDDDEDDRTSTLTMYLIARK